MTQERLAAMPRSGGVFMEYPQLADVKHYVRSLPFEQRLSILTQGFHRGAAFAHCYSMREFVEAIGKREYDNPAGGVRWLDFDQVCDWLANVVGDAVLAEAIGRVRAESINMAEAVDRARLVTFVRVEQYNDVLGALSAEERAALGS